MSYRSFVAALFTIALAVLGCDAAAVDYFPRIVGGADAEVGEYPFQAALIYQDRLYCGCVILSAEYALTAAHCLDQAASDYTVKAGSNLLSNATSYTVVQYTLHENFQPSTYLPNDIAVLRVDPPFDLSENISPVELAPQGSENPDLTIAYSLGWGMTFSGSPLPDALQKVRLYTYGDLECLSVYINGPDYYNLCAGPWPLDSGRGTCGGDAGSALLIDGVLVGISSWQRTPCATDSIPAVFTQVSVFTNWIKEQANLP